MFADKFLIIARPVKFHLRFVQTEQIHVLIMDHMEDKARNFAERAGIGIIVTGVRS